MDQYGQGSSGSPGRVEGDLLPINNAGRCRWETVVMKNSISWPPEGSGWIVAENRLKVDTYTSAVDFEMHPLHGGLFSCILAFRSWMMGLLLAFTDGTLPSVVRMYCKWFKITFILAVGTVKWDLLKFYKFIE